MPPGFDDSESHIAYVTNQDFLEWLTRTANTEFAAKCLNLQPKRHVLLPTVASCIVFFNQSVTPPPQDLATLKRFMFQDYDLSNHTKKLRELEDAGEEELFGT
jgi:hypothetical protein